MENITKPTALALAGFIAMSTVLLVKAAEPKQETEEEIAQKILVQPTINEDIKSYLPYKSLVALAATSKALEAAYMPIIKQRYESLIKAWENPGTCKIATIKTTNDE